MQSEPDITVVEVKRNGKTFEVWFSKPVYLRGSLEKHIMWYAERPLRTTLGYTTYFDGDELGAYLWGLSVIQAHYARLAQEQADA